MAANPADKAAPTTLAVVVATAIISGITGYFIGQGTSIGLFGTSSGSGSSKSARTFHAPAQDDTDSDISDAASDAGDELADLKSFATGSEECKLVLVVRTDLGMTKGKSRKRLPLRVRISYLCPLAYQKIYHKENLQACKPACPPRDHRYNPTRSMRVSSSHSFSTPS